MARLPKLPPDFDTITSPVKVRVVESLLKLSAGLRKFAWDRAADAGLTPTQGEIVRLLARAGRGLRMRALADALGVRGPTATDSVNALEQKELVARINDENDGRVQLVVLTVKGRTLARQLDGWFDAVANAVGTLGERDEAMLLRVLLQLLRELQKSHGMPTVNMCVSCRHFSPDSSGDPELPHRCELVGASFADRHLRVDCPEQVPADDTRAADRWIRLRRK